ncbi:MAG: hypothetical protein KHZ15_08225 [Coprobacillus cateniformis]|uniref:hypothetical protein n=1 Tax=Longibaculum muris TaxID=1796628 RepID=UPI003AB3590E|nr:hypothetical protein [Coprobacillus cateniformis]
MIFCYCVEAILIIWIFVDFYRMKTCKDLAKINIVLMMISLLILSYIFWGNQKDIVDWIYSHYDFWGIYLFTQLIFLTTHFIADRKVKP